MLVARLTELLVKLANGQTPFEKAAIDLLIVYDLCTAPRAKCPSPFLL